MTDKEAHKPNRFSLQVRFLYFVFAVFFIVYGSMSIYQGRLIFPGDHGKRYSVIGLPRWLDYVAMFFATVALISVLCDHYDKRNNERKYKLFYKIATWLAGFFFILSTVIWAVYWPAYGTEI